MTVVVHPVLILLVAIVILPLTTHPLRDGNWRGGGGGGTRSHACRSRMAIGVTPLGGGRPADRDTHSIKAVSPTQPAENILSNGYDTCVTLVAEPV